VKDDSVNEVADWMKLPYMTESLGHFVDDNDDALVYVIAYLMYEVFDSMEAYYPD
jgi:hypothetical protein